MAKKKPKFEYDFPIYRPGFPMWYSENDDPPINIDSIIDRWAHEDFSQKPGLWGVVALAIVTGVEVPKNLPMFVYTEAMEFVAAFQRGERGCVCGRLCCEKHATLLTFSEISRRLAS